MWSGTLATIPTGWVLCDGTSGTPNLADRFVLGVNTGQDPGTVGGSSSHDHSVDPPNTVSSMGSVFTWVSQSSSEQAVNIQPHDHDVDIAAFNSALASNVPPYFRLAFIMKQ